MTEEKTNSRKEKYKVQVVKKEARTKAEFEALKADLEKKGFKIFSREYSSQDQSGESYFASILAERTIPADKALSLPTKRPKPPRARLGEKFLNLGVKTLWWTLFLIVALICLFFMIPFIVSILTLIKR